jgi:tetratricopeptide (TPR) repeat protein
MLNHKAACLALILLCASLAGAQSAKPALTQANAALQNGEADRALATLAELLAPGAALANAEQAQAHNLRCRVQFALEHWDSAVQECEAAVNLDRANSEHHMWLGRALGEKASRASFMRAFSLAKHVRAEFEEAVRLAPQSAPALADLADFYSGAPGVVGGGSEKAEKTIAQLERLNPARAHELRGQLAEKRKDLAAAEKEFRQAVAASQRPSPQWMMLAGFYKRHQRWAEMDAAIQSCIASAAREHRPAVGVYDAASVLNEAGREPELAVKLIQTYLAGPKSEEAPAFQAHTRLARLYDKLGDLPAARRERSAALALAHDYRPALDLKIAEANH